MSKLIVEIVHAFEDTVRAEALKDHLGGLKARDVVSDIQLRGVTSKGAAERVARMSALRQAWANDEVVPILLLSPAMLPEDWLFHEIQREYVADRTLAILLRPIDLDALPLPAGEVIRVGGSAISTAGYSDDAWAELAVVIRRRIERIGARMAMRRAVHEAVRDADTRILSLRLENFRPVEKFEASFDASFNVFIGENGRGKTTILEVLRRALEVLAGTERALVVDKEDVRTALRGKGGAPWRQPFHPCLVDLRGAAPDGKTFRGREGIGIDDPARLTDELRPCVSDLHERAHRDGQARLPLLVHFSPWRAEPSRERPVLPQDRPEERTRGYDDALDLHADLNRFAAWVKRLDQATEAEKKRFDDLELARGAVITCLPEFKDLRYYPSFDEVMVERVDGTLEPIWRLSDGYRTMVALVGEMAWRAALLNPNLGAASEVSGIALIDEIDLHLHPKWQRRVVGDLQRAFPRVQFFATTHSPFIIQSLRAEQVHNLDRSVTMAYQSSSIEDITEEAMGLLDVQRSRHFLAMQDAAAEFFEMLRRMDTEGGPDIPEVRRRYAELMEKYAGDPAYAALLRSEVAARGVDP